MKKLIATVLSLIMVLAVGFSVGCVNQPDNNKDTDKNPPETTQPNDKPTVENGGLYTVQVAYAAEILTLDDLMEIQYKKYNQVWVGESNDYKTWEIVEYIPKDTNTTINLTADVELSIKEAYYQLFKSQFYDSNGNSLGGVDDISIKCYGEYDNSYVVDINCSLWLTGAANMPSFIDGVIWWQGGGDTMVYCFA